jgi:hypothetical protein
MCPNEFEKIGHDSTRLGSTVTQPTAESFLTSKCLSCRDRSSPDSALALVTQSAMETDKGEDVNG